MMLVLALALAVFGCQSRDAANPGVDTQTPVVTATEESSVPAVDTQTPVVTATEESSLPAVDTQTPVVTAREESSVPTNRFQAVSPCGPVTGQNLDSPPDVHLWTPDGSHLIFSNGGAIWIVDEQGDQLRMVLNATAGITTFGTATVVGLLGFMNGFHADLSPDGTQLVYTSCQFPTEYEPARAQPVRGDLEWTGLYKYEQEVLWYERGKYNYEIALSGLDGEDQQRITHNQGLDHYPVWSPKGDRIAFIGEGGNFIGQLYTMLPDGSDVQSLGLVDMVIFHIPPVWSPDGQRLAFLARPRVDFRAGPIKLPLPRNVYTVRPDGSELVKVGEMGGIGAPVNWDTTTAPIWSPDSERIAFAGFNGEEVTIHTVRFDGEDLRRVWGDEPDDYSHIPYVSQMFWSPDGAELVFVTDGIYVVRLDGSGLRQLAVLVEGQLPVFAWSPDGSRIAAYHTKGVWWPTTTTRPYPSYTVYDTLLYTLSRDGTDLRVLVGAERNGELRLVQSNTDPATSTPDPALPKPTATAPPPGLGQ